MLNLNDLKIISGTWDDLAEDAKSIREAVFIQEQKIDAEDEWDEQDPICLHFVLYLKEHAVATARLLSNQSIGRVAVLENYRGKQIGQHLMKAVIQYAQEQGFPYVKLSSQVHALKFYQALGFLEQGEQYLDCGIPHIDMYLYF